MNFSSFHISFLNIVLRILVKKDIFSILNTKSIFEFLQKILSSLLFIFSFSLIISIVFVASLFLSVS